MKRLLFFLFLSTLITSCGSSRKTVSHSNHSTTSSRKIKPVTKSITQTALSYEGTRYKYGGTTKKGMDCSGLVYTSFKKEKIILPRTSKAMATLGNKVSLKKVAVGDLLFFKTNKNKNVINHVGLVVNIGGGIKFIHASVSKGVTVSSLNEKYWRNCFVGIKRIL